MAGKLLNIHSGSKLVLSVFTTLISALVFLMVGAVVAIPFFGLEAFTSIMNGTSNYSMEAVPLLKYLQLVQSIGLFIAPALILAFLFGSSTLDYLKLKRKPIATSLLIIVLIMFAASPLINIIGIWNGNMNLPSWMEGIEQKMRTMEEATEALIQMFLKTDTTSGFIFNLFLIAVIPALGEEFLFRGVIQRVLNEWTKNHHAAIWIAAAAFSFLHFQFYGFLPRMILGAMFGYMLVWSGNLWLPILAHFINNATAVVAYYFYNAGKLKIDPDEIGTGPNNVMWGIISLVALCSLFYALYEQERKNRPRLHEAN